MKFEIELPASSLKQAMSGLGKVIPRSGLPVLRSIRLARTDTGEVSLQATDLESSVTYRLPESCPGTPGIMLVPWDAINKALKNTKERLAIAQEAENQVILRSFVRSIAFEEPVETPALSEWPVLPRVDEQVFVADQTFKSAFIEAMECASVDERRLILNGVCLEVSPKGHYLIGTDGRRLYAANSFQFGLKESIIVPKRKFLAWRDFSDDGDWAIEFRAYENSSWVQFRSSHWTYAARLIDGNYPNWRQVIPASTEQLTKVTIPPSELEMLVEAVPRLPTSDQLSNSVALHVEKGRVSIRSRLREGASVNELAVKGAEVNGPDQVIALSRDDLLCPLRNGFNQLELRDSLTPAVFRSGGRFMLIMPVRMGEEVPAAPAAVNTPPPTGKLNNANSSDGPPSPAAEQIQQPQPVTEIKDNTSTMTPVTTTEHAATKLVGTNGEHTPFKAALNHMENLRNGIKNLLGEISDSVALLKAAERDQKATEKEIESVRSTLRSLKKVEI